MDVERLNAEFEEMVAGLGLADRYYDLWEQLYDATVVKSGAGVSFDAAIMSLPLAFDYFKQDDFYRHSVNLGTVGLNLHVSQQYGEVEFSVWASTGRVTIGGSFHRLAEQASLLDDPDFRHDPQYPRLPYKTKPHLTRILNFGLEMFQEIVDEFKRELADKLTKIAF